MPSGSESESGSDRSGSVAPDHDDIDHNVDKSNSDGSDESDDDENHGFLDVEAVESGDESHEGDTDDESEDGFEFESFPQFTRLPIELRQRIWEIFDPDMRAPARIFGFRMPFSGANELHEGPLLERQTAPARAVLATHHESREYALKYYPDAIEKGGEPGIIRYRKESDIIMVSGYFRDFASISSWQESDVFTGIRNIALDLEGTAEHQYEDLLSTERPQWPNLQSTYFVTQAITHRTRNLRWCGSDAVQTYHLQVEELDTGLGEDYEAFYCWPQGREREHTNLPIFGHEEEEDGEEEGEGINKSSLGQKCSVIKIGEETIWPIVVFDFEGSGVHRHDKLREIYPVGGNWEEADDWHSDEFSGDEEDELSPDEYESEGIDDGSIDEDEASGDEDDLQVLDDDSEQEFDTSVFNGFSPPPDDSAAAVEPANFSSVEPESAHFSSIEPESPDHSDAEASDTADESVRNVQRPGRRVLADSEDESGDESEDEEQNDAQPTTRRKRAIMSDSEEEEGEDMGVEDEQARLSNRRKRVVMSDSEEEEEETEEEEQTEPNKRRKRVATSDSEDEEEPTRATKRRRRAAMPESDDDDDSATEQGEAESVSDDDSEDDEDESEDEKPQKKPSLAERLQLFRSEVPVAPSPEAGSEPDSDMEQLRNGDYDDPFADTYDRDDDGDLDALSENDQLLDMDEDEEDPYGDDGGY
ncbi:hypothetical protein PG997_006362 [Apiospora hydei]|uniref:2EXR domain-containing protein n=1 Tax=Apiospora hydei TaxID=1337664 RepID=A0ABR1WNI8_9PEZI